MRSFGGIIHSIVLCTLCLSACKSVSQKYDEDLSYVRPSMPAKQIDASYFMNKSDTMTAADSLETAPNTEFIIHRIDSLAKVLEKYKKVKGWRVQVYSGSNFEEASKAREGVVKLLFANIEGDQPEVYREYDGTNFRVKVGNYIDKLRAYRTLVVIKGDHDFRNSLLVPDKVYLDKID